MHNQSQIIGLLSKHGRLNQRQLVALLARGDVTEEHVLSAIRGAVGDTVIRRVCGIEDDAIYEIRDKQYALAVRSDLEEGVPRALRSRKGIEVAWMAVAAVGRSSATMGAC